MEVDCKGIQQRNLEALVRNKGFQFTDVFFPYTSGQIGPYYVQSIVIEKNGFDYKNAIDDMCEIIDNFLAPSSFDIISGGESRDWDFSNPAAYNLSKAHSKIYKDGKILGADIFDQARVVHVADLNNEGSSPRDLWVPAIKKAGGIINDIFFYVDRMEEGTEVMKELGLNSHALVPLDDHAWDYLQKINVINADVYLSLKERGQTTESRKQWAYNMLRSERGFNELYRLFGNPKTRDKAQKIVDKGYPELKDELMNRLVEKGNL